MDTRSTWRRATARLAAVAVFSALALPAQAAITEVQPGDLAGAATRPYNGPADPILHFTDGDGNPDNVDVATYFGMQNDVGDEHCTRLNSPPGPSGTVFYNGVVFNYTYDPATQTTYFNWDANAPVLWVVAKGGNSAYVFSYIYDTNPADGVPDGEVEDFALRSPATGGGNPAGLSHFDFCFRDPPPTIDKTAIGSWKRYNDWELDKDGTPNPIRMFDGDSHDVEYTITATKTSWGQYTISGIIEISDVLDRGFNVDWVTDAIVFSDDGTNTPYPVVPTCQDVDDGDVFHRCTYTFTIDSTAVSFDPGAGGVNAATAQLSFGGNTVMIATTESFSFGAPAEEFGASLSVDDTMLPGDPDHVFNASGEFTYQHTFICPDNDGDNPNTATGTYSTGPGTTAQAMANETVEVTCEVVTVTKTADTSFDADYAWTADKKIVVRPADVTEEDKATHCSLITSGVHTGNYACDDITLVLLSGASYATEYQLRAIRSAANESNWLVFGGITVSWPSGMSPVFSGDPTDVLEFDSGLPATLAATVSNCVRDDVAHEITCDYTASPGAKRDGTNRASIDRPHVCYDKDGLPTACDVPDSSTYEGTADFAFGNTPDTETDACVAVDDLFNDGGLNLGPTFGWQVDDEVCGTATYYVTGNVGPGDLTLFADWYNGDPEIDECVFRVPNLLMLSTNDTATASNDGAHIDVFVADLCDDGCTLTQGYWKTHSKYGPAPYDETWAVIGEDTFFFNSGRSWYTTFWTPPKGGNAYLQLAHQYMAARLNVEAGASVSGNVASAMAQAEAMFGAVGSSFNSSQTKTARQLAGLLDAYNNGEIGPGHCSEAPARAMLMMK